MAIGPRSQGACEVQYSSPRAKQPFVSRALAASSAAPRTRASARPRSTRPDGSAAGAPPGQARHAPPRCPAWVATLSWGFRPFSGPLARELVVSPPTLAQRPQGGALLPPTQVHKRLVQPEAGEVVRSPTIGRISVEIPRRPLHGEDVGRGHVAVGAVVPGASGDSGCGAAARTSSAVIEARRISRGGRPRIPTRREPGSRRDGPDSSYRYRPTRPLHWSWPTAPSELRGPWR